LVTHEVTSRLCNVGDKKNDKKTACHFMVGPMGDFSNFFKEDLLRIESIYEYFDPGDKLF